MEIKPHPKDFVKIRGWEKVYKNEIIRARGVEHLGPTEKDGIDTPEMDVSHIDISHNVILHCVHV